MSLSETVLAAYTMAYAREVSLSSRTISESIVLPWSPNTPPGNRVGNVLAAIHRQSLGTTQLSAIYLSIRLARPVSATASSATMQQGSR
jgi:hypothetical protein